jgi:CHASE3 domain sensor protein
MGETHKSALPYAPILLGAAFIATLFIVAESGYQRIHQAGQVISQAEERQALMARYLRLMLDAESAQRGFLLTEDPRYLRNFDPAVRALDPMLDRIVLQLREGGFAEDADKAQALRTLAGKKVGEMQMALRLYGEVSRDAALELVDADLGQRTMNDLRHLLRELWDAETTREFRARPADLTHIAGGGELPQPRARGAGRRAAGARHAPAREGGGGTRRQEP